MSSLHTFQVRARIPCNQSTASPQPVYSHFTSNCRCTSVGNADSHDILSKIEQRNSSLSRHAMVPVDTKRVSIIFLQQPSCCVCFALTSKVENVVVCVHVGCGATLGCNSTSVAASQGNPGLDNIVCTPFKKQSTHSNHTTNAQLAHIQCTSLQSTYMQLTTSLQPVYNQTTTNPQPACRVGDHSPSGSNLPAPKYTIVLSASTCVPSQRHFQQPWYPRCECDIRSQQAGKSAHANKLITYIVTHFALNSA